MQYPGRTAHVQTHRCLNMGTRGAGLRRNKIKVRWVSRNKVTVNGIEGASPGERAAKGEAKKEGSREPYPPRSGFTMAVRQAYRSAAARPDGLSQLLRGAGFHKA